jgi:hypothetical protein
MRTKAMPAKKPVRENSKAAGLTPAPAFMEIRSVAVNPAVSVREMV